MEHLQHFGISQDPFQNEPDLRFYFDSASHRDAQLRAERSLRQAKGLAVLTGAGGAGKTLLARRILNELEEEMFESNLVVMLPGVSDVDSVLKRFATQIGVEPPAADRAQLLGQVYESLAMVREDGRRSVLILDDAHYLGPAATEEIGALLNLEYEDRRLLSLLLVGMPELEQTIPSSSHLGQRIEVRVHLRELGLNDTHAYLGHRLSLVNGRADLIAPEAVEVLHKFARGRPRLLNTLADNGLFEAFLAGRQQLGAMDVERAALSLGVGAEPGSTFGAPQPPGPAESDLPLPQPTETLEPLSEEPLAVAEGEGASSPTIAITGDPHIEALVGGSDAAAERTTLLSVYDLGGKTFDAEVEAAFEPTPDPPFASERTPEPGGPPAIEFRRRSSSALAEPTRIAFLEETAPDTAGDSAEDSAPSSEFSDEIDDLFGELMDD